jgi:hypothetical protein
MAQQMPKVTFQWNFTKVFPRCAGMIKGSHKKSIDRAYMTTRKKRRDCPIIHNLHAAAATEVLVAIRSSGGKFIPGAPIRTIPLKESLLYISLWRSEKCHDFRKNIYNKK